MKKRLEICLLSILITIVFIYFSIPNFFSREKVRDLLSRVNEYQDYFENE